MNFRNIRVYGHEYEPEFFRNDGWRGRWLRFLNALRLSLELRCQWHAMYLLGKRQGVDLHKLTAQVEKDQQKIREYISDSGDYERISTATPKEFADLPTPSERTRKSLARLTAHGRARRYRKGRHLFMIQETEEYTNGPAEERQRESEPVTFDAPSAEEATGHSETH